MFQTEEQHIKFIKTYLNKLKLQQSISQQQVTAFYNQLDSISENKRRNLIQRAFSISQEFQNHIPDKYKQDSNNQKQQKVFQSKNRFLGLDMNDTNGSYIKKIIQTRGSLNNAFALQNTILALLIDGYTNQCGNNKKMFNYLYSNGNRGVLLNFFHVQQVDQKLEAYFNQNIVKDLLKKHTLNRLEHNYEPNDQLVQPEVLKMDKEQNIKNNMELQQTEEAQEIINTDYKKDELLPTFSSLQIFRQLFIPERMTGLHSEVQFCLKPEEFEMFDYGYSIDETLFTNVIQRLDAQEQSQSQYQIFGLDCEMVQTGEDRKDLSLARVTLVDNKMNVIFDEVCRPSAQVIDYLTKYSGITPELLDGAQSQDELMQKFINLFLKLGVRPPTQANRSGKSQLNDEDLKFPIFIGHGLDNDFKYLNIAPQFVIDTAVLLRVGKHKKLKLKYLAEVILEKQIQNETEDIGHSSEEDAIAAIELVYGYFYAFGNEALKTTYEEYKHVGEKIIKKYGGGSQGILTRLQNAQQKAWYTVNVYWKDNLEHYIQEFAQQNTFIQFTSLESLLQEYETYNNRFFIINEDYLNNFKTQSYIQDVGSKLPRGSIIITILNVNNQSQSLVLSHIIQ